jgi:hypothetical protein
MDAVLNVVLPVFGIMLAGYLAGHFRILGESSGEALNAFVYYVSLPALFFISMSRVEVSEIFNAQYLLAVGGGILGTFGIAMLVATYWFPNRVGALGLNGLTSVFSNTGYIGIPLLILAFGERATLPAVIATVLNGTVVLAVATVIIEIDLNQKSGVPTILRNALAGVFSSPLVMSALAGLLFSAAGIPVPGAFGAFCDLLAASAGPCALFAMGLFMVGRSFTAGAGEISVIVLLKLVLHPLLAAWLAFGVMDMDPIWASSAVILAALPTGALVFVLAKRYDIYTHRSTAAIMISTVISVVTISVLLNLLDVG